jgi:hypothetical protein
MPRDYNRIYAFCHVSGRIPRRRPPGSRLDGRRRFRFGMDGDRALLPRERDSSRRGRQTCRGAFDESPA